MITYRSLTYFSPSPPIAKAEPTKPIASPPVEASKPTPQPVVAASDPVIAAKAMRRVDPVYPAFAKSVNVSGSVVVEVTIDEQGKVVKADAVAGPGPLRQAAVDAAKHWEFQPATQNNKPILSVSRITFNFTK